MSKINLQDKAKAKKGSAEKFWFENEFTGLEKTLFHRITIPLTTFNSGLEYESQPVKTQISIDWIILNLLDTNDLDGLIISSKTHEKMEASVYIGGAHNWCDVETLSLKRKKENTYFIKGTLAIDFENEGVAENEMFSFETTINFDVNSTPN
jgi:hypothetical protein